MNSIVSYSPVSANQAVFDLLDLDNFTGKRMLDVGAGEGYFIKKIGDFLTYKNTYSLPDHLFACDLNPHNFKDDRIPCQYMNFNQPLPYPDNFFDYTVSIEVIEHLENQFSFISELVRITKPGGKVIVTTPNLLNINSRLKYFYSGFTLLFDPLPLDEKNEVHTTGHIHPVTLYYLFYIFHHSGLRKITLHTDRVKRSGLFYLLPFYPIIKTFFFLYRLKDEQKKKRCFEGKRHDFSFAQTPLNAFVPETIILSGEKSPD